MHVLVIPSDMYKIEKYPLGGIFQLHQINALKNAGLKLGVISIQRISRSDMLLPFRYHKEEYIDGVPVLRKYFRSICRTYSAQGLDQLLKSMRKNAHKLFVKYSERYGMPDCIHAHDIDFAGMLGHYLKKTFNVPYAITLHSSKFGRKLLPPSWEVRVQDVLDEADQIVVVSQSMRNDIISTYRNIEHKTIVLHNVIDSSLEHLDTHNKLQRQEPFCFFSLGRLDKNKNHVGLIHAFGKAFKGENCILRIAGDGELFPDLAKEIMRLGMEEQVELLGYLNREQVIHEMSQSDSFVLSSLYETFGVVLIEALCFGKPVIATACGGPNDIVSPDNGILVHVNDVDELACAMTQMYKNHANYSAQQIRLDAINNFGAASFASKALSIYKKCVQNNL